ncbi:hypothetical protein BDR06DRAFT_974978 [Suillus hirtellus]|nr:hypothetical protein BDR06DRAFT_974978 [Suillus hirtellus]
MRVDNGASMLVTEKCQNVRMGSTMDIDLPLSLNSGTYGCVDITMEDDECKIGPLAVIPADNKAPEKRLIHSLQKTVDKYLQCHLYEKVPTLTRFMSAFILHFKLHY